MLLPTARSTLLATLLLAACTGKGSDSGGSGADGGSGAEGSGGAGSGADDSGRPGHDTGEPPLDADQRADNLASASEKFALDFLTDATYDRLVIEVDYVVGNAPEDDALDALVDAVSELCHKPGGVEVVLDDELPPQGSPEWTYEAAEDLEVAWRDRYRDPDGGTAVLYFLYLDGSSEFDEGGGYVLGYAYHGSSLVMFRERIDQAGGALSLLASVEDTVIVHELGHVLGLVNNGIDMVTDHQDTGHGAHDSDDDCIMYWAVETDAIGDILGTSVPTFDDACRADIAAAGGKDTTR